jgi:DNA primase
MKTAADHIEFLKSTVPVDVVFRALDFDHITKCGMFLCPFHEDHKPSLSVRDKYYHCFSSVCQASGDAFTLVMKIKKCSFPEAIKFLESLC